MPLLWSEQSRLQPPQLLQSLNGLADKNCTLGFLLPLNLPGCACIPVSLCSDVKTSFARTDGYMTQKHLGRFLGRHVLKSLILHAFWLNAVVVLAKAERMTEVAHLQHLLRTWKRTLHN